MTTSSESASVLCFRSMSGIRIFWSSTSSANLTLATWQPAYRELISNVQLLKVEQHTV